MTLKDGSLGGVAVAAGEGEAAPLLAVWRTPRAEQDVVDPVGSDLRAILRIDYPAKHNYTTYFFQLGRVPVAWSRVMLTGAPQEWRRPW